MLRHLNYRSPGFNPVCLANRAIMRGPISSLSWSVAAARRLACWAARRAGLVRRLLLDARTTGRNTVQHALRTQIFIYIGPVDAVTVTNDLVILVLCWRRF